MRKLWRKFQAWLHDRRKHTYRHREYFWRHEYRTGPGGIKIEGWLWECKYCGEIDKYIFFEGKPPIFKNKEGKWRIGNLAS